MKRNKIITSLLGLLFAMTVQAQQSYLDFTKLTNPTSPNYYLACPKSVCRSATPNLSNHVYELQPQRLFEQWQKMIAKQPRVEEIYADPQRGQWRYTQTTKWLRFTDEITVQFIPIDSNTTGLAIFSQSRLGYYDFGVNGRRVHRWLKALEKEIHESATEIQDQ